MVEITTEMIEKAGLADLFLEAAERLVKQKEEELKKGRE